MCVCVCVCVCSATDRGGQQEQFALGPHPKQCRTCSNKIRSSVTFQSSFINGLVSLYFRLKSACSFALRFMLLTQIIQVIERKVAHTPSLLSCRTVR